MYSEEVCLICSDEIEKHIFVTADKSKKIQQACMSYLHDVIITNSLKKIQIESETRLPFCYNCFDFASDLIKLTERLVKVQKEVLDLATVFSLSVFHRKSQVNNFGDVQPHTPSKKIIQIDVGEISTHRIFSRRSKRTWNDGKGLTVEKNGDENVKPNNNDTSELVEIKLESAESSIDDYDDSDDHLQEPQDLEVHSGDNADDDDDHHSTYEEEPSPNKSNTSHTADETFEETGTKAAHLTMSDLRRSVRLPQINIRKLHWEGGSIKRDPSQSECKIDNYSDSEEESTVEPVSDFEEEMKNRKNRTKASRKRKGAKKQIMIYSANCEYCPEVFQYKRHLEHHYRQCHSTESRVKCTTCEKTFVNATMLKYHQRIHTGEKRYKCSICGRAFTTTSTRSRHERTHIPDKKFLCSLCPKTFKLQSSLTIHLRTHAPVKTVFQCATCGKTFAEKSFMKVHEKVHLEEKPHKCRYCDKTFTMGYHRTRHERTHTGEKPYKCSHCEKRFSHSQAKVLHERTHTGEKPHQCQFCEMGFTSSSAMKQHERIHTGEKPYSCLICDKTFRTGSLFRIHGRTHTGEKPYKCSHCEEVFTSSGSKLRHEKRFHPLHTPITEIDEEAEVSEVSDSDKKVEDSTTVAKV